MLNPLAKPCGARRKYDGQPCQNPAMPNGKCRIHGGRTPEKHAIINMKSAGYREQGGSDGTHAGLKSVTVQKSNYQYCLSRLWQLGSAALGSY